MELTMTNSFGFCELNEQEMMMVDGGVNGKAVGAIAFGAVVGIATIAGVIAVAPIAATTGVGMGIGCLLASGSFISSGCISGGIVSL